ncbi:MAG: hypothetical protein XU15_C0004G0076 [candidate division NC10 bacterium CSP1-5]|nr:MAG: hypothetical protein XU15_C0004G0076 [candidate division NC10 bacterium CSP1-5]
MSEDRVEKFLTTAEAYSRALREGWEHIGSLQQHEDKMVVWIIGLAAGAVIALLAYIIDVNRTPQWALLLSLGPFVLAVVAGVAYRLVLAEVMERDMLFAAKKVHALEALKFRTFEGAEGSDQLAREVLAIMDDKPDTLAKLKYRLDRIQRVANRLRFMPYTLFALGVVIAPVISVCLR